MHVVCETERLLLRRFAASPAAFHGARRRAPRRARQRPGGDALPHQGHADALEVVEQDVCPGCCGTTSALPGLAGGRAATASATSIRGLVRAGATRGRQRRGGRVGYRLRRAAQGQGMATEGSRALIRTVLSELGGQAVPMFPMLHPRCAPPLSARRMTTRGHLSSPRSASCARMRRSPSVSSDSARARNPSRS